MQGRPYRSLLILIAVALLIIPAAVIFFNEQISLTGTAIQQSISQSDSEGDAPSSEDQSADEESDSQDDETSSEDAQTSSEESSDDAGDSESEDSSADPTGDEADAEEPSADPTDDEADSEEPSVEPTDDEADSEEPAVEPTEDEADTDESGGDDDAEATEEAGDNSGGDEQPEATEEPSGSDTAEATEEPSSEPTPAPETTEEPALEVTAEVTPEIIPEATTEPIVLDVALACGPGGVEFTVTNAGADMTSAETYTIDDTASGELQLASGESTTMSAGFGTPLFSAAGSSAQPDEPCLPPPALEVSAVCTAETGATFVITNSGGPMPEAQAYTLDGETAGEFQLGAGGTSTIEAGYGSPAFASGDLEAALEETCNPPGSIGGEVWLDVDGDGTRGEDEAAIAEVTITLADSEGVTQEAISAEDGRYEFIHLRPGNYTVQINEAPAATRPSHDAEGEADSSANITVAFEAIRADFGYQPLGTISGVVWLDVNGDGIRSEDETRIADVAITLTNSEDSTQETISAEDGSYGFADLPYGDYSVQIASAPVDTLPTYDAEGDADSSALVTLSSEGASADFGYQAIIKPAISGVVWADLNGDGVRDEGEPGLSNIPVMLTGTTVEAQAVTDASGAYGFVDLAAGEYGVSIASDALGENYSVTADAAATVLPLADEPIVDVNFGLQPARMGAISGLIWLETGDFGVRNAGETGIAGVVVELLDSAGAVIQTITLEAGGRFTFIDLIPGTYSIRISEESLPDRLFVTYNPDGSSTLITQVVLPAGVDVEDVEFGLVGAF